MVEAVNPPRPAKRMSATVTRVPAAVRSMVQYGNRAQTRNARMPLSPRAADTSGASLFLGTFSGANVTARCHHEKVPYS